MCGKIINPKIITPRVVSPRLVTPKTIMSVAGSAKPKPIPEPDALNFYMPDGGTITLTRNGNPTVVELEYSIDGGATWQVWEEVGNIRSLTLAAGGKMYVRNTSETSTGFSTNRQNYYNFAFSSSCYAFGNTNSVLCKNPDNAIISENCFCGFYALSRNLIKASELPSKSLANRCYYDFCYGAFDLEVGPSILPAEVVPDYAYYRFFMSTKVTEIKTNMTTIIGGGITNWTYNVQPQGDFYCPAELTIPTGDSGIPSGWTRHDI